MIDLATKFMHIPDEKSKTGLSARQYVWRLIVAALFFFVCAFFNVLSSVVAAYRTPNIRVVNTAGTEMTGSRTLPDFGHFALDFIQLRMDTTSAYILERLDPNFCVAHVTHTFVFLLVIHPQRLMLARRTCGIVGYIFLARCLCVLPTSIPDSHHQCYDQFGTPSADYKSRPMFPEAIWTTFSTMAAFSDSVTCGDMIFSGHMVLLTCGCLFFYKYCNRRDMASPLISFLPTWFCMVLRYSVYVCCVLGTIAIVKSRLHYSVDVIIACYFTMNSWNVYHRTAYDLLHRTDRLENNKRSRLMEFSPFTVFFEWLESIEMQGQDKLVWEAADPARRSAMTYEPE